MAEKEIWIPQAIKSKSALKKQLHIPQTEKIDPKLLQRIKQQEKGSTVTSGGRTVKVTPCLKKRATLALTLKKLQHRKY